MSKPSIDRADSYVRIHYVRYADDFVIGVEGSYTIARTVLQEVEAFVNEKLALTFNQEKTGIINYSSQPINFLGFTIKAPHFKGKVKPLETVKDKGRLITRRKKIRITINMDTQKVLKKLANNGFIKKRTSHSQHAKLIYRGTFKGNLINLDHADIIKYYNSKVRGIFNYYNFTKNRSSVA
jgi:RNA-directed DNA polymerase